MGFTKHTSVRFGIYEVDLDSGELYKGGVRIKLQQQPFRILHALLEHPGELVTRDDLHTRIWPGLAYGDFDQAVNVAVAKLRAGLGDSADNPRFIETLPRRGYRFIAPVQAEDVAGGAAARSDVTQEQQSARKAEHLVAIPRKRRIIASSIAVGLVLLVAALILSMRTKEPVFTFHRISFGKGAIRSARFGPDGHSMLYGAAWNGKAMQLFWTQPEGPESRPFLVPDADILAVSSTGELAILINRRADVGWISRGTLALLPIAGATPRRLLDNVQNADFDHDGKNLAIVRWTGKRCDLEYPIGTIIYGVTGGNWISDVRVSPRGDRLAFLEHPLEGDDAGTLGVVDLSGHKKTLTHFWPSIRGLAWDPSGDSLWFSASEMQAEHERPRAIYRLNLRGDLKEIVGESGNLTLHDVSRGGVLLVTRDVERYEILGDIAGKSRDLSWLDFSRADDLSADGRNVLLTVEGEAVGKNYETFLRKTDGSPPVRLGEGYGSAISPDGQWALVIVPFDSGAGAAPQLTLLPIGTGTRQIFTHDVIAHYSGAWFPDGKQIAFLGSKPGRRTQTWVQDLQGGAPRPITPEGVLGTRISPDGKLLCAADADGAVSIYPITGEKPTPLNGIDKRESVVGWSKDGQSLFVARSDYLPVRIYRIDRQSRRRELVRELAPPDPAGVLPGVSSVFATPDGRSFVYSYFRLQSDLYIITSK